ncbi:AraC family transcriptional regulator [Streptomonospora sp. DSM 45055]|uniref:AraC family transcriptional regulator n=1 Tax=Streptomonospora wellingtoniae TaxID=3075544 RepID=A0ABU2KMM1_9ACTN|nr:AraC family transcriptional regulator [Streptomonospora sp. DSM 45055]MDT0300509.1 AraC family transcriptional regulator [Streptomonospora sp. DSM 45055]
MAPSTAAPLRDAGAPQDRATDRRRLPLYGAGEIDVPFVVQSSVETIPGDTFWEVHSHPTHELLWNERGASSAAIGGRVWTITATAALWVPAGTPHSGRAPAGIRHRAAHFAFDAVPSISDVPVAVELTTLLRLLLDRLEAERLSPGARARTEAVVLDLLVPARHELTLRIPDSPMLAPIAAAVRDDPSDATTLAVWASRLGVSTRTITRTFRSETGLGFSRWVAAARMQQAAAMLARGDRLDEVAERVGYHSASSFGAAFRRSTGMSPGRFRAQ